MSNQKISHELSNFKIKLTSGPTEPTLRQLVNTEFAALAKKVTILGKGGRGKTKKQLRQLVKSLREELEAAQEMLKKINTLKANITPVYKRSNIAAHATWSERLTAYCRSVLTAPARELLEFTTRDYKKKIKSVAKMIDTTVKLVQRLEKQAAASIEPARK